MSGMRQLRELSAARIGTHGQQDRRISRNSDGDDSRPLSPDKQVLSHPVRHQA
jgi:hypothetical protein